MLKPFELRDTGLVNRLRDYTVPFNAAHVLTQSAHPIRGALLHKTLKRNYPTYVRRGRNAGFMQLMLDAQRTHAHMLWMASVPPAKPHDAVHSELWLEMLDDVTVEMARMGVQSIVAEVRENSPEQAILREAGFANYTRQDIWRIDNAPSLHQPSIMAQRQRTHDWDIELLYSHIVPPLIRIVEPHPPLSKDSWVRYEGHDLAAYANVETGVKANWLTLYVRLDADTNVDRLVGSVLRHKPPAPQKPLYCRIRNYQEWLQTALQHNGFGYVQSQQVMVKQTVQRVVQKPAVSLEQVLQGSQATAQTRPIVQKSEIGKAVE